MWIECGWCKNEGKVTVYGCYDNNGDMHKCKGCTYQNCPSPLAETSYGVCPECVEEHKRQKYQRSILEDDFDGLGCA